MSFARFAVRLTVFLLYSRDDKENPNHTYNVPSGQNHYVIPRNGFILFFDMEIYVKAVNQLGEATSLPITLEPVSAGRKERTQSWMSSLLGGEMFQFFFFFSPMEIQFPFSRW